VIGGVVSVNSLCLDYNIVCRKMQGEYEELQMLLSEKEAEDEVPEKMPFLIICKKIPFSPLTN
jgi:hypothetical protein